MERKTRLFTQGWHYFFEGTILSYFVLLWERFSLYHDLSFWNFYLVLIPSVIVFFGLSYFNIHRLSYLFVLFVMGGSFCLLNFPIGIALLFSALLTYRYYRIEKAETFYKEASYFAVALAIACLTYIWARNPDIYWVLFIQFITLFSGYYIKNLINVPSGDNKKQYVAPFGYIFTIMVACGMLIMFLYSGVITRILGFVYQGFSYLYVGSTASFAHYIDDTFTIEEFEPQMLGFEGDDGIFKSELGPSTTDAVQNFFVVYLIITIALIAVLVLFIHRIFKRKSGDKLESVESEHYGQFVEDMSRQSKYRSERSIRSKFKKPKHPVRRLVYQFERKLSKTNFRRKRFETIEDWLLRIGADSELPVYQKVRYGLKEVDQAEVENLKHELRTLEKQLKQQS